MEKVGKVRLSKSGKALEAELNNLPCTLFTLYLYVHGVAVKQILDEKKTEASISLLAADERNLSAENKELHE